MTDGIELRLPSEKWGDFVTLTIYAFTFLMIAVAIIVNGRRNKVRYDGISFFMLSKTIILCGLFTLGSIAVFYPDIRPYWLRWLLRVAGSTVNLGLFTAIISITFPKSRFVKWSRSTRLYHWGVRHNPWRVNA